MIKDFLQDALTLLAPDHPNWYGWAQTDSDGNKIPNDQRMQTQYVIVNLEHEGIVTRPTDQAINDKVAELQAKYDANQYQRDRAEQYPSIQDQLDKIYHSGLTAWKADIKAVKDKFPKP